MCMSLCSPSLETFQCRSCFISITVFRKRVLDKEIKGFWCAYYFLGIHSWIRESLETNLNDFIVLYIHICSCASSVEAPTSGELTHHPLQTEKALFRCFLDRYVKWGVEGQVESKMFYWILSLLYPGPEIKILWANH